MAAFNINSDAAVVFTNKLEKMHRSALPNAVRGALNGAAFDVKKNTMPNAASSTFESRKKNFFRATSSVKPAKGFNLKTMVATVGFVGGDKNQAVQDLEKQERGGKIGGRSFIPTPSARVSKSPKKMVRKPNRITNIRAIDRIKSNKDFHRTINRVGVKGHVIHKNVLYEIKKINRGKIKLLPLFSYQKNRAVKIGATHFMKKASMKTQKQLPSFYVKEAKRQIKRLKK